MVRFNPIYEYLNKIEGLFENVEQISQGGYLKKGLPYFRGVSDESLELLPSAYRPNNTCFSKVDFQNHEKDCLRSFMREARRYSSIPEEDVWNWTVLAQHHGVPTRLLDITRNPLVALWFSCLHDSDKDGAVYVISGNLQISGIPNLCPLSWWCHQTISSSVVPFSSCPESFQPSGSLQMSQLFTLGGQSTGVSASTSVLPMNTQD